MIERICPAFEMYVERLSVMAPYWDAPVDLLGTQLSVLYSLYRICGFVCMIAATAIES